MTRRRRGREVALQLLFQHDQNPTPLAPAEAARFARDRLQSDSVAQEWVMELYNGVLQHQSAIDARLAATADNWRLTRMNPVDRNILRMGVYELLFSPDPNPVAIILDEMIELARRFGTADSPAFVNGILDRIAQEKGRDS